MSKTERKSEKILVVEDNLQNMQLVAYLLEDAGFTVLKAEDAEAARALVGESIPDLVLMDMRLPGMDGLALTKEFKARPEFSSVPIIALTAHAMRGDKERFLAGGCDGYISKPISVKTFIGEVSEFLVSGKEGADDE